MCSVRGVSYVRRDTPPVRCETADAAMYESKRSGRNRITEGRSPTA
jgi:PleD family two-component response regulator